MKILTGQKVIVRLENDDTVTYIRHACLDGTGFWTNAKGETFSNSTDLEIEYQRQLAASQNPSKKLSLTKKFEENGTNSKR